MHVNNLHARLKLNSNFFEQAADKLNHTADNSLNNYQTIYIDLLEQQRFLLNKMNRSEEFDEELIRKYLSLIDLEEFKIREKTLREPYSD